MNDQPNTAFMPDDPWEEHPDYPANDWAVACENGDTRQSYVDWVNKQICDE